ncbi:hypothetical protein J4Q44_G00288330, partial [Coregonus suidteri]
MEFSSPVVDTVLLLISSSGSSQGPTVSYYCTPAPRAAFIIPQVRSSSSRPLLLATRSGQDPSKTLHCGSKITTNCQLYAVPAVRGWLRHRGEKNSNWRYATHLPNPSPTPMPPTTHQWVQRLCQPHLLPRRLRRAGRQMPGRPVSQWARQGGEGSWGSLALVAADGDPLVPPVRRRGGLVDHRDVIKAHQSHKLQSTPQARRKEW